MEDRIKELENENETLRSYVQGIRAFEKEMHDNSLKIAKEIKRRDSKAAANIILNMGFGNRNNVSFCEIFELREAGGCKEHEYCTDCIHSFLKKCLLATEPEMTVREPERGQDGANRADPNNSPSAIEKLLNALSDGKCKGIKGATAYKIAQFAAEMGLI